jgi:hypothetical protein
MTLTTRLRHARLGLADTKDPYLDSALFIQKQEFSSSTP